MLRWEISHRSQRHRLWMALFRLQLPPLDMPRPRALASGVACMLILAATAGCTDQDQSSAGGRPPQQSSAPASVAPEPVVARLDRPTERARLRPIPQEFPTSLEGMPAYVPERSHLALLAYRPYESPNDGSGWASEEIGIYSRDGEWARLDLSTLGLDYSLWPGVDTIGPGALDSGGRWLALSASDGVVVVDLLTGRAQNLLGSSGPVACVRSASVQHQTHRQRAQRPRPDRRRLVRSRRAITSSDAQPGIPA